MKAGETTPAFFNHKSIRAYNVVNFVKCFVLIVVMRAASMLSVVVQQVTLWSLWFI